MTRREASILVCNVLLTYERNTSAWESAQQITALTDLPPPPSLVEGFIALLMRFEAPK